MQRFEGLEVPYQRGPSQGDRGARSDWTLQRPENRQGFGQKKLSIRKLHAAEDSFGDAAGHHGIFEGNDFLGYVHSDDLRRHVANHAEDFADLWDRERAPGGTGGSGKGEKVLEPFERRKPGAVVVDASEVRRRASEVIRHQRRNAGIAL